MALLKIHCDLAASVDKGTADKSGDCQHVQSNCHCDAVVTHLCATSEVGGSNPEPY